jgi:hypothetical protein
MREAPNHSLHLERLQRRVLKAGPDFGLPATIETFDAGLYPHFVGHREHGNDPRLRHKRMTVPMVSGY